MTPEWVLLALRLGLAIALYAFLGAVLWFLWKDTRQAQRFPREAPSGYLHFLEGERVGEYHSLRSVNEIGRAADNSLTLMDETVSAYHARISYQGGQWWLEDLGSRNGTTVNALLVEEPMVVTYGDAIMFGRVETRLEPGAQPPREESLASAEVTVDS